MTERDKANAGYARHLKLRKIEERAVFAFLIAAASVSIVTTVAILVILLADSIPFFTEVSFWSFITDAEWDPPQRFGLLPLLSGTMLVSVIAVAVAFTLGLGSAIYLAEYAPSKVAKTVKPILEILSGIPTVVFGYFALTFVTPLLQSLFGIELVFTFNALSAGIVMGLLITPLVATLSEDAMRAVPRSLRYSAYALGATKLEVILKVVVPAALSGVMASFVLALSRAVGETLIVTIAAGLRPNITASPFESIQTITAAIVRTVQGEAPRGSLDYQALFALGLALFVVTLSLNLIGRWIVKRHRLKYE